jgi:hypothetical protein
MSSGISAGEIGGIVGGTLGGLLLVSIAITLFSIRSRKQGLAETHIESELETVPVERKEEPEVASGRTLRYPVENESLGGRLKP